MWTGMSTKSIALVLLLAGPSAQAKEVTVQVNGHTVRLDVVAPARPSVADWA